MAGFHFNTSLWFKASVNRTFAEDIKHNPDKPTDLSVCDSLQDQLWKPIINYQATFTFFLVNNSRQHIPEEIP